MANISPEHKKYIKSHKIKKYAVHLMQIFLFFLFLFVWQVCADQNYIDSFIFSSPRKIILCFLDMFQKQELLSHINITLLETFASFILVTILGTGIAILLWLFPTFAKIIEPYLVILNSLPKSALAPLLIVWLGANEKTIIVAGISVAIFGSILNIYTGFKETDQDKLKLVSTLGGTKLQKLTKIILPSSVPLLLSVMKVNIGLCLVGVIIGEFIGAKRGLGYLIIYGSQTFKLTWVLMSIVILCIISILLYGIINLLELFIRNKT